MRARKHRLSRERVTRMDALGFHWELHEELWEQASTCEACTAQRGRLFPEGLAER